MLVEFDIYSIKYFCINKIKRLFLVCFLNLLYYYKIFSLNQNQRKSTLFLMTYDSKLKINLNIFQALDIKRLQLRLNNFANVK